MDMKFIIFSRVYTLSCVSCSAISVTIGCIAIGGHLWPGDIYVSKLQENQKFLPQRAHAGPEHVCGPDRRKTREFRSHTGTGEGSPACSREELHPLEQGTHSLYVKGVGSHEEKEMERPQPAPLNK